MQGQGQGQGTVNDSDDTRLTISTDVLLHVSCPVAWPSGIGGEGAVGRGLGPRGAWGFLDWQSYPWSQTGPDEG